MLEQRTPTDARRAASGAADDHDDPMPADTDVARLADEARSPTIPGTAAALFVAGGAVAVAIVMLVVQNTEPATVEWWAWDPTGPMWIVLALTFVAGLFMGPVLVGGYVLARTRRRHRDERIDQLAGSSGRQ